MAWKVKRYSRSGFLKFWAEGAVLKSCKRRCKNTEENRPGETRGRGILRLPTPGLKGEGLTETRTGEALFP